MEEDKGTGERIREWMGKRGRNGERERERME